MMDSLALAQTLYRLARCDLNTDNIGRLTLTDLTETLQPLTPRQIITLFHEFYPGVTVEQRTPNILLVYFDGKEATRDRRNVNVTVPPLNSVVAQPSEGEPETYQDPEEYYSSEETIW